MDKLKTLEDWNNLNGLESTQDGENCLTLTILRKEAIKWIKDINKIMNTEGSLCDVKYCDCSANWIKDFFNITDEDLK